MGPANKVVAGYNLAGYATDPRHASAVGGLYQATKNIMTPEQADTYIQTVAPGSPISGQMIWQESARTGVEPGLLMALFQQESHFGTMGLATRTLNPGNVGGDNPAPQYYMPTWQQGVGITADWLAKHRVGDTSTPISAARNMVAGPGAPSQEQAVSQYIAPTVGEEAPRVAPFVPYSKPPFGLTMENFEKANEEVRKDLSLPYDVAAKEATTRHINASTQATRLGLPSSVTQTLDLSSVGLPGVKVQLNGQQATQLGEHISALGMEKLRLQEQIQQSQAINDLRTMQQKNLELQMKDREEAAAVGKAYITAHGDEPVYPGATVKWKDLSPGQVFDMLKKQTDEASRLQVAQEVEQRQLEVSKAREVQKAYNLLKFDIMQSQMVESKAKQLIESRLAMDKKRLGRGSKAQPMSLEAAKEAVINNEMASAFGAGWDKYIRAGGTAGQGNADPLGLRR